MHVWGGIIILMVHSFDIIYGQVVKVGGGGE